MLNARYLAVACLAVAAAASLIALRMSPEWRDGLLLIQIAAAGLGAYLLIRGEQNRTGMRVLFYLLAVGMLVPLFGLAVALRTGEAGAILSSAVGVAVVGGLAWYLRQYRK